MKAEIKKLLEALKPFAEYGLVIKENPFEKHIPNDVQLQEIFGSPTKGDVIKAMEVYKEINGQVEYPKHLPKPRRPA